MSIDQEKNFVIKYSPDNKVKTGFMRTGTEKFYLGQDGILSIVPIGTAESQFCGVFKDDALTNIPAEFVKRVSRNLEKITYMYFVLQGKVK